MVEQHVASMLLYLHGSAAIKTINNTDLTFSGSLHLMAWSK